MATTTNFNQVIIDDGLQLTDSVPSSTTNKLYNDGGTLTFNGSAVGGGGGSSYTAGSGLTLTGSEFNIYGGSGHFDQVLFDDGKVKLGNNSSITNYSLFPVGGPPQSGVVIGDYANYGNNGSYVTWYTPSFGGLTVDLVFTRNIVIGDYAGSNGGFGDSVLIGSSAGENTNYYASGAFGGGGFLASSGYNDVVAVGTHAFSNVSTSSTQGNQNGFVTAVGYGALADSTNVSNSITALGHSAGRYANNPYACTYIGINAGLSGVGNYNSGFGRAANYSIDGSYNVAIGNYALGNVTGSRNIEIVANAATNSIVGSNSDKIHIHQAFIGDTSTRLYAIGNVNSADLTPDATLEIKPRLATDVGVIIQGAVTQTANLQEWQDSSESVLAYVKSDGSLVTSSGNFSGNVAISGSLTAATKSFLIDHPSKEGMKLQYASLEGPENGVYVRGTTDEGFITLPDYWRDLVHNGSITVTLTPVGQFQPLFVEQKNNREIRVGGVCGYYDYVVYGERKDVDKLEVEW